MACRYWLRSDRNKRSPPQTLDLEIWSSIEGTTGSVLRILCRYVYSGWTMLFARRSQRRKRLLHFAVRPQWVSRISSNFKCPSSLLCPFACSSSSISGNILKRSVPFLQNEQEHQEMKRCKSRNVAWSGSLEELVHRILPDNYSEGSIRHKAWQLPCCHLQRVQLQQL